MKQRKSFLLRLDPLLYAALEEWSGQELRSVNAQVEFLLREAVNRRKRFLIRPESGEAESAEAESTDPESMTPPSAQEE